MAWTHHKGVFAESNSNYRVAIAKYSTAGGTYTVSGGLAAADKLIDAVGMRFSGTITGVADPLLASITAANTVYLSMATTMTNSAVVITYLDVSL